MNTMYRNKQWLKTRYFKDQMLMSEIADMCGVQRETVARFFLRFGLKGRSHSKRHMGKWNGRWKGGRQHRKLYGGKHFSTKEYIMIPLNGRRVREHRLVMEKTLKRSLKPEETVHHKDGNTINNHPDNLKLFPTREEHRDYEIMLNYFVKRLLFGDLKTTNRTKLIAMFENTLSKNDQDIST